MNESDRSVYLKELEEWEKADDEKKHYFAIIDPQRKPNEKIHGKTTGETYEQWKSL